MNKHMLNVAISGQDYNDARVRDFEDGMFVYTFHDKNTYRFTNLYSGKLG